MSSLSTSKNTYRRCIHWCAVCLIEPALLPLSCCQSTTHRAKKRRTMARRRDNTADSRHSVVMCKSFGAAARLSFLFFLFFLLLLLPLLLITNGIINPHVYIRRRDSSRPHISNNEKGKKKKERKKTHVYLFRCCSLQLSKMMFSFCCRPFFYISFWVETRQRSDVWREVTNRLVDVYILRVSSSAMCFDFLFFVFPSFLGFLPCHPGS